MVAANYQTAEHMSESEFDRWNFYIIFISKDSISKELKIKLKTINSPVERLLKTLMPKNLIMKKPTF
jgi:hypothetical protein